MEAFGSSSLCTQVLPSLTEMLPLILGLLVLRYGSSKIGCFTSIAEEGGVGAKSMWLTVDALSIEIFCNLSMFGVRPSIWTGVFGGLNLLCAASQPLIWCCHFVRRRKINIRVLIVISTLLRDFAVRLRFTLF